MFAVTICICLLVSIACFASADLGDFGGDGDYGGGDDFGGDYDWDDSGSRSSSGSSVEVADPVVVIITLSGFAIYALILIIKNKRNGGAKSRAGAVATPDERIIPIEDYSDYSDGFACVSA